MRAAILPALTPADRAAADDAAIDRQLAILGELAEAGLEIARALEAQAKGGDVVVQGDVAMAYNRVARAVRHTLMLQAKIIEARKARREGEAGRKAAARAGAARILRGVIDDDPAHDRADDHGRNERLSTEAAERLRAEDFGDLLSLPFADAVAAICKDLGLAPDWLQLAEDCHAAQAALSGKGGAEPEEEPYAGPIQVRWLSGTPSRSRDSS